MKTSVIDIKGKKIKDIELKKEIFDTKINEPLVHQLVKAELASLRQGTASTKTRAEVSGGGAKPWRQKGTGRARAGSNRSPLWRGGGVTFGPAPRDFAAKMPRRMRKNALRSIFSAKAKDKELLILDKLEVKEPKTKEAKKILENLKLDKKSTILIDRPNESIEKSFRNLPKVRVIDIGLLNAYDILDNRILILTQAALVRLTEVLA